MKKSDQMYLNSISAIGFIACRLQGTPGTPAEMHHPRTGEESGAGLKAPHSQAIPLCPAHHRGTDHPRTPSIHLNKDRFIAMFGTEAELLEATRAVLAKMNECLEGAF